MSTPQHILNKIYFLNEKLEKMDLYERTIYRMQVLNFILQGQSIYEILKNAFSGDFNPKHDYFYTDEFGYLNSLGGTEIEKKLDSMFAELDNLKEK